MALQKTKEVLNSGVTCNYWRITKLDLDLEANETRCRISGYVTKELRNLGKHPLTKVDYVFTGKDNPITKDDLASGEATSKCYTKILTKPEFIDATNI